MGYTGNERKWMREDGEWTYEMEVEFMKGREYRKPSAASMTDSKGAAAFLPPTSEE